MARWICKICGGKKVVLYHSGDGRCYSQQCLAKGSVEE